MRRFLDSVDHYDVEREVSPRFEMPAVAAEAEKPVVFRNVEGSDHGAVFNLAGTKHLLAHSMGCAPEDTTECLLHAMEKPGEVHVEDQRDGWREDLSIHDLPVATHFERDGGPYLTAGVVVAELDGERNASIHRMMVRDDGNLGIRVVPRHLRRMFEESERRGEDLRVGVALGLEPATLLAVSTRVPYGFDEFGLAAGLLDREFDLERTPGGAHVPRCEIALDARILADVREPEAPFVDITGTYDEVRQEPVIEIDAIRAPEDALYQGIVPAGREHALLMGTPYESVIYRSASNSGDVLDVAMTPGSRNYLGCVVKMRTGTGDPTNVGIAALSAHPSMKHVTVVSEDVDVYSAQDVEYSVSTRFRADRDLTVIDDVKASSLDPRKDEDGKTGKMIVDATVKGDDPSRFKEESMPGQGDVELGEYVE